MTENDVPSGPLARLRAQLAGPRGYRRIEALLSYDDAPGAIAALSPSEIFELVHEVGFEDGQALLEYATPAQFQGCFDLDGWSRDQLEVAALRPWIAALIEVGFEKVGEVWGSLDAELRALILQRSIAKVYDVSLGEEPADDNDEPILATPDRMFMLELQGDEDGQRLVQRLVEDLYRADAYLARHTIMSARSEPSAELEEMSYRWRAGRLADLGYVDFYDALDLFRPLPVEQVLVGEGSQDPVTDEPTRLPMIVAEQVVGRSFLARALAAIDDPAEAERLESALVVLVNKVLAVGRAKPGEPEVVKRGALYATATLSLGLETVARAESARDRSIASAGEAGSRTELARATQALRTVSVVRLFRAGYTVTMKLAKLASAVAARSPTSGSPTKELVAALCSPRPLFARAADEPPQAGLRPFESQADLRRASELLAGLAVRIALVEGFGVDVVAMGQAPEPRPELDDHVRTALARVLGGGELRGEALSQAELATLRTRGFAGARLSPEARRAGHAAIAARLGAAQLAASADVGAKLGDGWHESALSELVEVVAAVPDVEYAPAPVDRA